jgi:hypothetical protein
MDPFAGPLRTGRLIPTWNLERGLTLIAELRKQLYTNLKCESETWLYVKPTLYFQGDCIFDRRRLLLREVACFGGCRALANSPPRELPR